MAEDVKQVVTVRLAGYELYALEQLAALTWRQRSDALRQALVCQRCGNSFTTVRDSRRKPEFGPPYRHYTCSGYHRYGKATCGLVRIAGQALDEFVLATIKRVLLGDHATTDQAIDAFVKSVLAPAKGAKQTPDAQRDLEQLDRRIKTTVKMLADLTFEGLDDLQKVLADLKAKRDALLKRMPSMQREQKPALSEQQLRTWAREQFDRLDELAKRTTVDLKDRQLVEAFVQRIEIFPETKTGVVVLHADLESAMQSCSTRVVGGDRTRSRVKAIRFAWDRGKIG